MRRALLLCALQIPAPPPGTAQQPRTTYEVRYIAAGAVYLNGGSSTGLAEGFRLTVKRLGPGEAELSARVIGEIEVVNVSSHSAVCEIRRSTEAFQVGDRAYLSEQDSETLRAALASRTARPYPQVVSFSEGDPLEEELREYVPRRPSPEVNRLRGRLGIEHNSIVDTGSPARSRSDQEGLVIRLDMTRIGGTFWNATGYWRGRLLSRRGASQQTLSELLNRTYHIGMYYNNPQSSYTAGFGRMLVPWASSLNTIDGGYFARRLSKSLTAGVFAGSTPDPTAWNYNPDRQIAGVFVSAESGTFEHVRLTSTTGVAATRLRWKAERDFAFFENGLFFKDVLTIYHNLEADRLVKGRFGLTRDGAALSRSYLTFRLHPWRRLTLDLNHNYFRNVPTFETALIGTGLVDRLLFTGFSGGARLDLSRRLAVYTTIGRSRRDGDGRPSWNQMYGVTHQSAGWTGLRADFRYSQFESSFAKGSYRTVSVSRELSGKLRLELQAGEQELSSELSQNHRARFVTSYLDWFLGTHYILGGGFSAYRGQLQNYDQVTVTLGYRF